MLFSQMYSHFILLGAPILRLWLKPNTVTYLQTIVAYNKVINIMPIACGPQCVKTVFPMSLKIMRVQEGCQ